MRTGEAFAIGRGRRPRQRSGEPSSCFDTSCHRGGKEGLRGAASDHTEAPGGCVGRLPAHQATFSSTALWKPSKRLWAEAGLLPG